MHQPRLTCILGLVRSVAAASVGTAVGARGCLVLGLEVENLAHRMSVGSASSRGIGIRSFVASRSAVPARPHAKAATVATSFRYSSPPALAGGAAFSALLSGEHTIIVHL